MVRAAPSARRLPGFLLTLGLLVTYVALVPLHTQDGPNHRQVAALLARLVHGTTAGSPYVTHLSLLHTDLLFSAGYALLGGPAGLSVYTYERVFVAGFLLLLVGGYRWFVNAWAPGSRDWWVWILPVTTHALFVTGMYNFLAATALTFPALVLLRRALLGASTPALVAFVAVTWLAFLAHPFPFFVLPVAWAWLWVGRGRGPGLRGWVAGAALAAFLIPGFVVPLLRGDGPASPWVFKPPLELVAGLWYYDFPAFSVGHVVAAVPALTAALLMMILTLRGGVGRRNVLWLAMLAGYFLFPSEGHGGAHLNERFLPFAWASLPLALPGGGSAEGGADSGAGPRLRGGVGGPAGRWLRGAAVLSAVLMAAALWRGFAAVGTQVADASSALHSLPSGARLYPMEFDPGGPSLTHSPLTHLWANYPTERTVRSPYLFVFSDLMPVSRAHPASPTYFPATAENLAERLADGRVCGPSDPSEMVDCPTAEAAAWHDLLGAAAYYDYWFVHAPPSRWREALDTVPGLVLVDEVGRSSLWRYTAARPFDPPLP